MIGSVEPSKTYNIVPGARTSRSSVLCPGGELRRLIDELLPTRAVLRELGPLLEVRCNACPRERLVQRVPERELWTPMRPWPTNPGGEKLPWRPILCHARDVASPSKLAKRNVVVYRLQLHFFQQL